MENLSEKIKLPSNWMLVNPDSIWRFLIAIAKTGNVFNKEQLVKSGLYTSNEDNISRNLAYLKYLGIVDEERGKGKDQKFKVVGGQNVRNIIYELKAGREESAKEKLREHLQNHILFETLKKEFFGDENAKTLHELEHFLNDGMPGKNPQYYQKGGEFLIKLLSLASLTEIEGNDITLKDHNRVSGSEHPTTAVTEITSPDADKTQGMQATPKPAFDEIETITPSKYTVQFIGPGMNTKLEIQEEDDFLIVEATLSKIKKKLLSNATN